MKLSSAVLVVTVTSLWMEYPSAYFGEEHVAEKIVDITKGLNDKCSYRGLILKNDMKILLISDPSTNKSLASMTVGVGGLNDFTKVQGLASLVGYMVLLGSRTYPVSFELREFVTSHDGKFHTPITSANTQRSGFDIDPVYLDEALDRFARLFTEPLLTLNHYDNTFVETAMLFIDTEFRVKASNDIHRITQVEKTICQKNHPYCNLFNGSFSTLFEHMRDTANILKWKDHQHPALASLYTKAQQFYKNWYTSNNMALVVIGKETLNGLEEMVVPRFKDMQNGKPLKFIFGPTYQPWGKEQLGHMIYVFTKSDIHLLRLTFTVPDTTEHYRTDPETFIPNLISYDGPKSLRTLLRDLHLASDLNFAYESAAGIAFFKINCQLEEYTAEKVEEVINIIFQYIYLVKLCDRDTLKRKFNETANALHAAFLNQHYIVENPSIYAEELGARLLRYPMKDVVRINYFLDQWNEMLIREFLDRLKPENMNVTVASKSVFEKTNKNEIHFGTLYGVEKIPDELNEKWSQIELIPDAELHPFNEFMPESFNVYPSGENEPKYPTLFHTSSKTEIWFKQDDTLRMPKLVVIVEMQLSPSGRSGPYFEIFSYIIEEGLKQTLAKYLPEAKRAGFHWETKFGTQEICFTLCGYDDKLPPLLGKFLSKIKNFGREMDQQYFQDVLERWSVNLRDNIIPSHLHQMEWYFSSLMMGDWTPETLYNISTRIRYDDFEKYLSRRFRRVFVRALIYGNCTRDRAMDIVNIIESTFSTSSGMLLQEIMRPRVVDMADGAVYLYQTLNKTRDVYAYHSIFRINDELADLKLRVATILFFKIIRDSCFKILSNMKLIENPIVRCDINSFYNVQVFSIAAVFSDEVKPSTVDKIVEEFLQEAIIMAGSTSKNYFKQFKNTIAEEMKILFDSDEPLKDLAFDNWVEISSRIYDFRRSEILTELVHAMKISDLTAIFQKMLTATSPQRSKLTVRVFPKGTEKTNPSIMEIPQEATKLEDINDLLSRSGLLPIIIWPESPLEEERNFRLKRIKRAKGKKMRRVPTG